MGRRRNPDESRRDTLRGGAPEAAAGVRITSRASAAAAVSDQHPEESGDRHVSSALQQRRAPAGPVGGSAMSPNVLHIHLKVRG